MVFSKGRQEGLLRGRRKLVDSAVRCTRRTTVQVMLVAMSPTIAEIRVEQTVVEELRILQIWEFVLTEHGGRMDICSLVSLLTAFSWRGHARTRYVAMNRPKAGSLGFMTRPHLFCCMHAVSRSRQGRVDILPSS